ncbi:MFS transporter [Methanobacterium aggregans]|uniref:MFS transporter n=1 Tax=Methanobacterium aggregans TaxID=1615586 RepID=UPI00320D76DB
MEDPHINKWQILIAISIGAVMVPMNASIINVSLPTIATFFNASITTAEWVLTAYLITLLSMVLFFGRLGDFVGHERLYLAGLVGFIVSSILCSMSPSIMSLEIFRAIQGFSAAMMLSVSMGIVKRAFPKHQLGKAMGMYSVAVAVGLALGPAIGGIIGETFGWRFIFLVNVPLGIMSFIICYKVLVRGARRAVKWDIPGTLLQFACLFSLVYFLNYIENGLDTTALLIAGFSFTTLVLFIWNELHAKNPMLNLKIFKNRTFSAFDVSLHFNYICMYMLLFVMPFYLQKVLHLNANLTGLVLTASPLIMMFLAPVSGALSDKWGSRRPALLGSVISAFALLSMTQLQTTSTALDVFLRLALLGVGTALFQAPTNRALMASTPPKESGVASSIIVTTRNLGMVFAVCFGGILLNTAISPDVLQQGHLFSTAAQNLTTGMHRVVLLGAVLSILMALLAFIGLLKRTVVMEETERVVKKQKKIIQKQVAKQAHHISIVLHK